MLPRACRRANALRFRPARAALVGSKLLLCRRASARRGAGADCQPYFAPVFARLQRSGNQEIVFPFRVEQSFGRLPFPAGGLVALPIPPGRPVASTTISEAAISPAPSGSSFVACSLPPPRPGIVRHTETGSSQSPRRPAGLRASAGSSLSGRRTVHCPPVRPKKAALGTLWSWPPRVQLQCQIRDRFSPPPGNLFPGLGRPIRLRLLAAT